MAIKRFSEFRKGEDRIKVYAKGFNSNRSVQLTGNVTGSAQSDMDEGTTLSIATTIADNAITNSKLSDGAVSTSKLQDDAVTSAKIDTGAVTVNKLGAGAVETDKIANGAVTLQKISSSAIDTEPTDSSDNLITSGGVKIALDDKADKVSGATEGNLAGLDANGNLTDSGKNATDFVQSVKIGSGSELKDASGNVSIPLATTSANGAMSSADKTKLNGIAEGAEANVQADWDETSDSADSFIKHKPYYEKSLGAIGKIFKVFSSPKITSGGMNCYGIELFYRAGYGGIYGNLLFKDVFILQQTKIGAVQEWQTFKFYVSVGTDTFTFYAKNDDGYSTLRAAPLANLPKANVDFTDFGTEVDSIPEGATEITPVWVANSASSSGTAPVKVNAYGALTPVQMDSVPTASSTNLMTSGDIKTAIDAKVIGIDGVSGMGDDDVHAYTGAAVSDAISSAISGSTGGFLGNKTIAEMNAYANPKMGDNAIIIDTGTITIGNVSCVISQAPAEVRWTTSGSWVVTSSNYVNKNDVATSSKLGLVRTNPTDGGVILNNNNQMVVQGWDSKASASDVTSLTGRVTTAEGNISSLQTSVAGKVNASDAVWTIDDSDDAIIVDDDFMTWMFQA